MCLSLQAEVLSVKGNKAQVKIGQEERTVTSFVDVNKGDKVLITYGKIIEKL